MKTYVIERNIPGAGSLTAEQLKGISQTSCKVLNELEAFLDPSDVIYSTVNKTHSRVSTHET